MDMTPNLTLVAVIVVLVAAGVYLLLERTFTRVLLGFVLIGNGINLLFLVAGGRAGGPAIVGSTPEEFGRRMAAAAGIRNPQLVESLRNLPPGEREQFRQRFEKGAARCGLGRNGDPLRTDLFVRPRVGRPQLDLF